MYPTVEDNHTAVKKEDKSTGSISYTDEHDVVFLSLNRYERKKNIFLALDALHHLRIITPKYTDGRIGRSVLLVIAGGYDLSVLENVEYLKDLQAHCTSLNLPYVYQSKSSSLDDSNTNCDSDSGNNLVSLSLGQLRVTVIFRTSIPAWEREALLARSAALLYTPDR